MARSDIQTFRRPFPSREGNRNQYFKMICEMLLRSFILPKANDKVEHWLSLHKLRIKSIPSSSLPNPASWIKSLFSIQKRCQKYWPHLLITLVHIHDVLCSSAALDICSCTRYEFPLGLVETPVPNLHAVASSRRHQRGKQSPVLFSLLAYFLLPPPTSYQRVALLYFWAS